MAVSRVILRILCAVIIIFLGYLFWPSSPGFTHFDPGELARQDIASWEAQAKKEWFRLGRITYDVLTQEFGFSHFTALRMAWHHTAASRAFASGANDAQIKAFDELKAYYSIASRSVKSGAKPEALANGEFYLWTQSASKSPMIYSLIQVSAQQWAGMAGGQPQSYMEGAKKLVGGAYLYGRSGGKSLGAIDAERNLLEGYKLLLEATQQIQTADAPR